MTGDLFDGQTVVVTGAARGIGRAIANQFARDGAEIVIVDVEQPTDEVAEGEFVRTDVADPDAVEELFTLVEETHGTVDVLVNNAGVHSMDDELLDIDIADWNRIIGVNLTGTFLCSKFALPLLLEEEPGSIVNIASVAGLRASSMTPAYCASKAGITNFTRQLAIDYGGHGLRVNAVCPGVIESEMTRELLETEKGQEMLARIPGGDVGRPEMIADVVRFLASERARYVNGHALVADGGLTAKYY